MSFKCIVGLFWLLSAICIAQRYRGSHTIDRAAKPGRHRESYLGFGKFGKWVWGIQTSAFTAIDYRENIPMLLQIIYFIRHHAIDKLTSEESLFELRLDAQLLNFKYYWNGQEIHRSSECWPTCRMFVNPRSFDWKLKLKSQKSPRVLFNKVCRKWTQKRSSRDKISVFEASE